MNAGMFGSLITSIYNILYKIIFFNAEGVKFSQPTSSFSKKLPAQKNVLAAFAISDETLSKIVSDPPKLLANGVCMKRLEVFFHFSVSWVRKSVKISTPSSLRNSFFRMGRIWAAIEPGET